ncbi:MAG: hypothetical protein ACSHWS_07110 [Sulfitobacter sp.]
MSDKKAIILNTTSVKDDMSIRTGVGTYVAIVTMVALFFGLSWLASAG